VREIGLEVIEDRPSDDPAFNPDSYVWIYTGKLYIDPEKFHVGDFLHEAGHIAVLPSFIRPFATGDVEASAGPAMSLWLKNHPLKLTQWPEDPWVRAAIQCSDHEVIAWAYAAAVACGADPYLTVENGFSTEEARESAYQGCQTNVYLGINGLRAGGFIESVKTYPEMKQWLAP